LKIGRVVGNVVSTVKNDTHFGYKLMLIEYIDTHGKAISPRQIAFDGADAGVGDIVLINDDGGAAKMMLNDDEVIADLTICGVLDHFSYDGQIVHLD
jgi:microcompartment protein CcmK/EutM